MHESRALFCSVVGYLPIDTIFDRRTVYATTILKRVSTTKRLSISWSARYFSSRFHFGNLYGIDPTPKCWTILFTLTFDSHISIHDHYFLAVGKILILRENLRLYHQFIIHSKTNSESHLRVSSCYFNRIRANRNLYFPLIWLTTHNLGLLLTPLWSKIWREQYKIVKKWIRVLIPWSSKHLLIVRPSVRKFSMCSVYASIVH